MREIIILQDALVEARRITRDAAVRNVGESIPEWIQRIIASNHDASKVLMIAKAESQLAAQASSNVTQL